MIEWLTSTIPPWSLLVGIAAFVFAYYAPVGFDAWRNFQIARYEKRKARRPSLRSYEEREWAERIGPDQPPLDRERRVYGSIAFAFSAWSLTVATTSDEGFWFAILASLPFLVDSLWNIKNGRYGLDKDHTIVVDAEIGQKHPSTIIPREAYFGFLAGAGLAGFVALYLMLA